MRQDLIMNNLRVKFKLVKSQIISVLAFVVDEV